MAQIRRAKRGPYLKPLREEAKRQIRKLVIEQGYSLAEARDELKIPVRTFARYVNEIFSEVRKVLADNITDKEILNQFAILESRLSSHRRALLELAQDGKVNAMARVRAHTEAADMAMTIFHIYQQACDVIKDRSVKFRSEREMREEVERRSKETEEERKARLQQELDKEQHELYEGDEGYEEFQQQTAQKLSGSEREQYEKYYGIGRYAKKEEEEQPEQQRQ